MEHIPPVPVDTRPRKPTFGFPTCIEHVQERRCQDEQGIETVMMVLDLRQGTRETPRFVESLRHFADSLSAERRLRMGMPCQVFYRTAAPSA